MRAELNAEMGAVEQLQAMLTAEGAINAALTPSENVLAMLAQGAIIVNDWVISAEAIEGGYRLTFRRGSEVQTMDILNGMPGTNGKSAYETAKDGGYAGTEAEFAEMLKKAAETGAAQFETDETLTMENGVLRVNTADEAQENNTLPITSAAVAIQIGNIEILLQTI